MAEFVDRIFLPHGMWYFLALSQNMETGRNLVLLPSHTLAEEAARTAAFLRLVGQGSCSGCALHIGTRPRG